MTQRNRGIRKFARSSITAFAIKIGSAGLAFLMFVALSRAMDPVAYGVFGTVFSLTTLCAVIGSFGQRNNVMRFASSYDETDQSELRRGVIQFGYTVTVLGCFVAGVAGTLFVLFFLDEITEIWTITGVVVLTVGFGLTEYQSRAMRVSGSISLSLLPRDILWRTLIVASAAGSAYFYGRMEDTAATWIWFLGGTLLLVCLIQWFAYERCMPSQTFLGTARSDRTLWMKESKGPWASLIITSAGANLSVILVGILIDVEQAGPFFSALRVAQLLNMLMLAIEVVLVPMISRNAATENWKLVQRLCTWTAVFGGGFGLIGAAIIFLSGNSLLSLFGPEVTSAYPALLILTFGFLLNTVAGATAPLMTMTGHAGQLAKFQLTGTLIGLISLPVAILWVGMEGAAICISGIVVYWNVRAWLFARRAIGVDPTIVSLISKPYRRKGDD